MILSAGRGLKTLFINSSNRNIKEFYVFRGGGMLNMALKDMSNKTGYKVVPASQIKCNRSRKKSPGGATGMCRVAGSSLQIA